MRKLSRLHVNAIRWLSALCIALIARGEDWPQFLGPRRDGSYNGPLATTWPKNGPKEVWQKEVGAGFAGPVVTNGKVFLFHRPGDEEKIECFDAATGKSLWSSGYAATYQDDFGFDPGPRSAPTVADGRVFTYGPDGIIGATDAATGKRLWRLDAKKEFVSKKGFFGRACAPLVVGDLVLLNVGGEVGSGIVALEVGTGKLCWRASEDEASYSSPTLAVFDGQTNALFLTRRSFLGLDPANGKVRFQFPFTPKISASVTAATPLVDGNLIFISASYSAGAAALKIENRKVQKLWEQDFVLSNHYATSVHSNGLLFGFDGRQEMRPAFVCVDWKTGKAKWRQEHFGAGSVLIAGDRLVILLETGELILAEASGEAYKELQRAQVLGSQLRAYPALADGFLYARDKGKLVKIDLSK
jgi:outer membrane protein assembly factor BamB